MRMGLGLLVLVGVAAASAATTSPDPTVDAIVADYIAARGGLQKIRSVQTLRQKGHAFADAGREAIVMRELKRPDKVRFEFTVQGITAAYVSDGRQGWQVTPFSGDMGVHPMSEAALTDAMEQADIEGPLVDWKAKGHKVTLEGHAAVGERDAFKLRVDLKSGGVRYDYIDVKTHYQLKIESTREFRGRRVQLETTFGDHKKTAGVLFPRTVEVAAVGRPQRMRVVVDSIEVNPPLSDARFQRIKPAE
jgi:outer membrane lipoprotein-sorting protein